MSRPSTTIAGEFEVAIVGVTFVDGYPDNLHRLHEMLWNADVLAQPAEQRELPVAVLQRNKYNEFDFNAIQVHVPALGLPDGFIGHLPAALAARLAPEMDEGTRWQGWVTNVVIAEGHEDRPGVRVHMKRVEP